MNKNPLNVTTENLFTVFLSLLLITIIIVAVSYFVVNQKTFIGPTLILLGILSLLPLMLIKTSFDILKSELLFGIIDNGILALFALSGAELFGILGAIVGSLVGNAVTDGVAGIFEGYAWQKITSSKIKEKRTMLTIALGKLSGCLLGGGAILTIFWTILNF